MKEIVVISGKGGTGKTSITASFAALAENAVLVDCDVDAADLHLVLGPEIISTHKFISGHEAVIRSDRCTRCALCYTHCRYQAIMPPQATSAYSVDPLACEGCGVCVHFCPVSAIDFPDRESGHWYISQTRFGSLVHAKLAIGGENSGKLVSQVRQSARELASEQKADLIITDGPPGIGCPVIASITGADAVVIVTEPTISAEHDLKRVLSLAEFFRIPAYICINKFDINPGLSEAIAYETKQMGAQVIGRIPYASCFTSAQIAGSPVVEYNSNSKNETNPIIQDITAMWEILDRKLRKETIHFIKEPQ